MLWIRSLINIAMLFDYFASIRAAILLESEVAVVWFNDQYNGTIVPNQNVFVEFPDLIEVNNLSKDAQRITLPVRMHVVSRVMTKPDMEIADAEIMAHEELVATIRDIMRGMVLVDAEDTQLSSPLIWAGYQHWHRYQGWMVTWLNFTCKVIV